MVEVAVGVGVEVEVEEEVAEVGNPDVQDMGEVVDRQGMNIAMRVVHSKEVWEGEGEEQEDVVGAEGAEGVGGVGGI